MFSSDTKVKKLWLNDIIIYLVILAIFLIVIVYFIVEMFVVIVSISLRSECLERISFIQRFQERVRSTLKLRILRFFVGEVFDLVLLLLLRRIRAIKTRVIVVIIVQLNLISTLSKWDAYISPMERCIMQRWDNKEGIVECFKLH